jgi:hypothetical protein
MDAWPGHTDEPRPRETLTSVDALTYNAADRVPDADALKIIRDRLAVKRLYSTGVNTT